MRLFGDRQESRLGPSPTISVSQAKYRSQNIATSIAEVTRTANRAAAAASPSPAIPNLREAVRDKAERLDCRSISRAWLCGAAQKEGRAEARPNRLKGIAATISYDDIRL